MSQTQSGAASFAACLQLFRCHPLAVAPLAIAPRPPGPDGPTGPGGHCRRMVLRHRTAGFFVLSQESEDRFTLRSWHARDGIDEEIRPREPAPDIVCQVVGSGLPVPRHGALLGWVMSKQVTTLLAVHSAPPARSAADVPVPVPEIRVLPLEGTSPQWHWPPFAVSPLDDFRLWEYVEWGEIADLAPLVTLGTGRALWVPSGEGRRTGHIVVTDNLRDNIFWVPAGVYADHWSLCEGIEPPSAGELLARPGVVDLARGTW